MKLRSALFVATIIAGSFLLFLVQPMIARMALPRLGGAPAVWNSAMLVYQMLLLGGYAYAHKLGGLKFKSQAVVHVSLLVLAMLWLPVGLSAFQPPANAATAFWVPYLLVTSIGPLFFAVAAQAPLMQRWFGLAEGAGEPYALYAASNLGSFGGLIAYPLLVEPYLAIPTQRLLWSGLYLLLVVLVAACALATLRTRRTEAETAVETAHDETIAPPDRKTMLRWVVLAAVPSGLMLSTTTHLTTDIMAMPLLWALPLGLYLLSFSIAFATNRVATDWIIRLSPIILLVTGAIVIGNPTQTLGLATSLLLLMTVAVALHGEMYRSRPDPKYLTLFYLLMSVGGALGGVFCALIAPLVFDWTWEHPILILAAAWLLPQTTYFPRNADGSAGPSHLAALAAIVLGAAGIMFLGDYFEPWVTTAFLTGLLVAIGLFMSGKRMIFILVMLAILLLNGLSVSLSYTMEGARVRSYFGVYTVYTDFERKIRRLDHGTTTHGLQRLDEPKAPTSYYGPTSGVGLAVANAPKLFGDKARIAIVGLGTGTLACYKQPGQVWKFYEIDPAVANIAKDREQFSFLSDCTPDAPIVIGDARLSLAGVPAKSIDLLAVDAFSSDAIPLHLLTQEAFDVYDRALSDKGIIMVHISNRWVDLRPVLIAEARARGWASAYRIDDVTSAKLALGLRASNWVVLARSPEQLARLTGPLAPQGQFPKGKVEWQALPTEAQRWTDDYASVLPLLYFWGRKTNDASE